MKLGIDLDGVLGNFTKAYAKLLVEVTGRDLIPAGFKGDDDPNWPTTWYWERELGYTAEEEKAVWKVITSTGNFWMDLEPLPTAWDSLVHLNRLAQYGKIDVYFLTHRFGHLAKWQTEMFLANHGMEHATVLLTQTDKTPLINGLGLNFFIDDKPQTIEKAAANCKVKHLFLKAAPYNAEVVGAKRVDSIQAALEDANLWVK